MVRTGARIIAGIVGPDAHLRRTAITVALNRCLSAVDLETQVWSDTGIVLGCRSSCAIERSAAGLLCQPDLAVVCSGEVYNAAALHLPARSERPDDLEHWLLQGYSERGADLLHQLDGRYSIALWDRRQRRLLLTRDRAGLKPLFIARQRGQLVFASDTRALRWLLDDARPAAASVAAYLLFNYPLGGQSFYQGIDMLPAGHIAAASADTPGSYALERPRPLPAAGGDYRTVLNDVLRQQAPPGGATAFHLSGGVDTSLLCHIARQQSAVPLTTITAFYDPDHADLKYSRSVAREIGSVHHEAALVTDELPATIQYLVQRLDSPVMAPGVPTFWLSARSAAALGLNEIVSGIGGDHPFTGLKRAPEGCATSENTDALFDACVNVTAETLLEFASGAQLRAVVAALRHSFAAQIDRSHEPSLAIEQFYAWNFLQEHLRMAEETHLDWDIDLRSPFMQPQVIELGIALSATDPGGAAAKGFLRAELQALGSIAAQRSDKAQMALSLDQIRAVLRPHMLRAFADERYRIPGLDYQRLAALAASSGPASRSRLRLLWVVYNIHLWLQSLDLPAPEW